MTYDELVLLARMTCSACPLQYEGVLHDGRSFYFRYRWGGASLGIGSTIEDAIRDYTASLEIAGDLDGWMTDEEYKDTFVRLYELHQSRTADIVKSED